MKKVSFSVHILGSLLAGLFAAAVVAAKHADRLISGLKKEPDLINRTTTFKGKNGSFIVGGTGLSLQKLSVLKRFLFRGQQDEIRLSESDKTASD